MELGTEALPVVLTGFAVLLLTVFRHLWAVNKDIVQNAADQNDKINEMAKRLNKLEFDNKLLKWRLRQQLEQNRKLRQQIQQLLAER